MSPPENTKDESTRHWFRWARARARLEAQAKPPPQRDLLRARKPGIAQLADCIDVDPSDIVELADFAEKLSIGLTVVGPELPLILGVADEFQKRGLPVFGPSRAAAELEGSKAFAKNFMKKHGIPTARFQVVSSAEEAKAVIKKEELGLPLVVKADGLAGGKGVTVAATIKKALDAADHLSQQKAGSRLVLEEFLEGEEVSFFVLSDGAKVFPLVAAQDAKGLSTGTRGPTREAWAPFVRPRC